MILIIQIHSIPFHYYEFVKPIEDIVKNKDIMFSSIHYDSLEPHHLEDAEKIIIAGTSLKDHGYLKDIDEFRWLTTINVPVLGICGGMQILAAVFNEELINGTEIGLHNISFIKDWLGFSGEVEVYGLHHNSVNPNFFERTVSCYQLILLWSN